MHVHGPERQEDRYKLDSRFGNIKCINAFWIARRRDFMIIIHDVIGGYVLLSCVSLDPVNLLGVVKQTPDFVFRESERISWSSSLNRSSNVSI